MWLNASVNESMDYSYTHAQDALHFHQAYFPLASYNPDLRQAAQTQWSAQPSTTSVPSSSSYPPPEAAQRLWHSAATTQQRSWPYSTPWSTDSSQIVRPPCQTWPGPQSSTLLGTTADQNVVHAPEVTYTPLPSQHGAAGSVWAYQQPNPARTLHESVKDSPAEHLLPRHAQQGHVTIAPSDATTGDILTERSPSAVGTIARPPNNGTL